MKTPTSPRSPSAVPVNLTRAELGTLLGALVAAGVDGADVTALRQKLRDAAARSAVDTNPQTQPK